MSTATKQMPKVNTVQLNEDISLFPQVHPVTEDMQMTKSGVSRLVMLDRYTFKDTEKKTLKENDFVILTVKEDPKFPARGFGFVTVIDRENNTAEVRVDDEFLPLLNEKEAETGTVVRSLDVIENLWKYIMSRLPNAMLQGLPV